MNREDYEGRKRALDERLASSIEILRAAHRVEHRALDFLWLSSPANPEPAESPALHAPGTGAERPAPASPAPPPRPRRRWSFVDLQDRILDLLAVLPEEFTREDVLRQLKDELPERSMLFRALDDLCRTGELMRVSIGSGRTPTLYRRAPEAERVADAQAEG